MESCQLAKSQLKSFSLHQSSLPQALSYDRSLRAPKLFRCPMQDEKGDIITKYTAEEARSLKARGAVRKVELRVYGFLVCRLQGSVKWVSI